MRPFMPHQEQAFRWGRDRQAIALFMEMRLGKTATAIRWANYQMKGLATMGGDPRFLVIAPVTTLDGWRRELLAEGVPPGAIASLVGMDLLNREAACAAVPALKGYPTWFLVNYEGVRVSAKLWGHFQWDVVILDESTRIKNPQAKVTKVIHQKFEDAPYRAILTGLPNPEGLLDFFSQMQFVNGGRFMGHSNFWSWRERFFLEVGYDWVPRRSRDGKPGTRQQVKSAVGELAFTMTRKEAKVGSILVHERRTVAMNGEQKRLWKDVKKHFKVGALETKSAGAQFVWFQRIAGGFHPDRSDPQLVSSAKYDEIRRLLDGELKAQQLVLWFHFNEELAYVFHSLRHDGFSVGALLGATPIDKRASRQARFRSGQSQVLCVQEALGQFGLDLSSADTEIFYSNSYSFETRAQAQDRIVHPKKTTPLLAIDLITEGTTDEDVVDTLQDKGIDARSFHSKLLDRIRRRLG